MSHPSSAPTSSNSSRAHTSTQSASEAGDLNSRGHTSIRTTQSQARPRTQSQGATGTTSSTMVTDALRRTQSISRVEGSIRPRSPVPMRRQTFQHEMATSTTSTGADAQSHTHIDVSGYSCTATQPSATQLHKVDEHYYSDHHSVAEKTQVRGITHRSSDEEEGATGTSSARQGKSWSDLDNAGEDRDWTDWGQQHDRWADYEIQETRDEQPAQRAWDDEETSHRRTSAKTRTATQSSSIPWTEPAIIPDRAAQRRAIEAREAQRREPVKAPKKPQAPKAESTRVPDRAAQRRAIEAREAQRRQVELKKPQQPAKSTEQKRQVGRTNYVYPTSRDAIASLEQRSYDQRRAEHRAASKAETRLQAEKNRLYDSGSKVRLKLVSDVLNLARIRTDIAEEDTRTPFEILTSPSSLDAAENAVEQRQTNLSGAQERENQIRYARNRLRELGQSEALEAVRDALDNARVETDHAYEDLEKALQRVERFKVKQAPRFRRPEPPSAPERPRPQAPPHYPHPHGFPSRYEPSYTDYLWLGDLERRETTSEAQQRASGLLTLAQRQEATAREEVRSQEFIVESLEREYKHQLTEGKSRMQTVAERALNLGQIQLAEAKEKLKEAEVKVDNLDRDLKDIKADQRFIESRQRR